MPVNEQQQPLSHAATIMPQVQQAERTFSGGGQLAIPNLIKSSDGQSDSSFLASLVPLASAGSPMNRASADVSQQKAGTPNE